MFSERVPPSLEPNRITQAVRRVRAAGRPLLDLTITNPTTAGFEYPSSMLAVLTSPGALRYDPQPFGLLDARRAVACDYARRGIEVTPERIVLTASTSEAYSLLFKLLCEPHGNAVMVPVPSYPLFAHLTALDGVQSIPYGLDYHGRWTIAGGGLKRRWTDRGPSRAGRQPQQSDRLGAVARGARNALDVLRRARRGAHHRRGVCGLSAGSEARGQRPGATRPSGQALSPFGLAVYPSPPGCRK